MRNYDFIVKDILMLFNSSSIVRACIIWISVLFYHGVIGKGFGKCFLQTLFFEECKVHEAYTLRQQNGVVDGVGSGICAEMIVSIYWTVKILSCCSKKIKICIWGSPCFYIQWYIQIQPLFQSIHHESFSAMLVVWHGRHMQSSRPIYSRLT